MVRPPVLIRMYSQLRVVAGYYLKISAGMEVVVAENSDKFIHTQTSLSLVGLSP